MTPNTIKMIQNCQNDTQIYQNDSNLSTWPPRIAKWLPRLPRRHPKLPKSRKLAKWLPKLPKWHPNLENDFRNFQILPKLYPFFTFRRHSGSVWGQSGWVAFSLESCGSRGGHVGVMWESFWDHFGVILGASGGHPEPSGSILRSPGASQGSVLASFAFLMTSLQQKWEP